jgi:hypothetical protein
VFPLFGGFFADGRMKQMRINVTVKLDGPDYIVMRGLEHIRCHDLEMLGSVLRDSGWTDSEIAMMLWQFRPLS